MTVTVPLLTEPVANDSDALTFAARAQVNFLELNPMMTALNLQNAENNSLNANVNVQSAATTIASQSALASSNYKGEWSTLSGALATPAAVSHGGLIYLLTESVANVALEVPGVSTKFVSISEGMEPFNPVVNGAMEIAQNATTFSTPITGDRVIDGWNFSTNAAGLTVTVSRISEATPNNAMAKWLKATVTSVGTIASNTFTFLANLIEGPDIARYVGKTFTLGFYFKSSRTGLHCVSIRNGSNTAAFVKQFNVVAANTAQFVAVTVEGGMNTAIGTWPLAAGASGLTLSFSLACGSTFGSATDGVWMSGGALATAGQVNLLSSVSSYLQVTEVQINLGRVARPYKAVSYTDDLQRCRRYYREFNFYMSGYGYSTSQCQQTYSFEQPMCKMPIFTTTPSSTVGMNAIGTVALGSNNDSCICGGEKNGVTGTFSAGGSVKVDARL